MDKQVEKMMTTQKDLKENMDMDLNQSMVLAHGVESGITTSCLKSECVKYRGEYYHKTHYAVGLDYNSKKLVFLTRNYLKKNIRKLFKNDLGYYLAYSEPNKYNDVNVISRYNILYENSKLEEDEDEAFIVPTNYKTINSDRNFRFDTNRSTFMHVSLGTSSSRRSVDTSRGYNIEECDDYERIIQEYNEFKIKLTPEVMGLKKYLHNKSFGIEAETSRGDVIPCTKKRYGFTTCRDGSIDNLEFVSVPMKGVKGLQSIINFFDENKSYVNTNYKCSLHVHIGNLRTDKFFLNALYNFLEIFQADYYNYFPFYKKVNVLGKSKHYTKPLLKLTSLHTKEDLSSKKLTMEKLNKNCDAIFSFLTDGIGSSKTYNRGNRRHPRARKWEIVNRYFNFNLINLVFGNRKTLEFRIHENTFNSSKVINQLLISIAIVNYVEKNIEACLKGTCITKLNELINISFEGDDAFNLLKYYNERALLFSRDKFSTFESYTNS
jgi:hypothetical protein